MVIPWENNKYKDFFLKRKEFKMSWIYKITNLKNNKIYIGYTKYTPEHRFQEHWLQRFQDNSILHKAMIKYGKKSFIVEGLEEFDETEDWCQKECFWIEKLHSQQPNGYNICEGGNKPPTHYGSDNIKSKITQLQFEELIQDLKSYNLDFAQIAKKYNLSQSQVERINKGEFRHLEGQDYPIRKLKRDQWIMGQIINDLKENILTQDEIERKYQIKSRTRLYDINNGKVGKKWFPQEKYPLRKGIKNRKPLYLL